jgi:SAM-dependent methyltransferase
MARFTRNLESAYQMMWDRWQAGLAPDTIRVQEGVAIAPPAPGFSLAQLEAGRIKAAPIVERISAYVKDGYWLDVDNSDPALMLAASEWGFTPVCVNSRAQNLSVFQKLGFETHDRDVSLLEQSERFRVISLTSLGCLSSSAEALQAARRLLSHNGVLFISTINHGLPLWQLVNETPPAGESGPLTRETLYALLEEHGFAPASYASSSLHRLGMDVIAFKTHGA